MLGYAPIDIMHVMETKAMRVSGQYFIIVAISIYAALKYVSAIISMKIFYSVFTAISCFAFLLEG